MDHNLRIGECHPLPPGPSAKQEGPEAGRQPQTDGGDVTFDILHGIIDGESCRYGTAGAVDIKPDILFRILGLQKQHLCHHQACRKLTDFLSQKDNPIRQQPGINVITPLPPAGLLYHIRYQIHAASPPFWKKPEVRAYFI